MVLLMVLCSVGGTVLGLVIWNPGPDDFLSLVPAMIGGVLGAFAGLVLGVALIRRRPPDPASNSSGTPVA